MNLEHQKYYNITHLTPKPRIPAYNATVETRFASCKLLFLILLLSSTWMAACSPQTASDLQPGADSPLQPTPAAPLSLEEQENHLRAALAENPSDTDTKYHLGLILAITAPEQAGDYLSAAAQSNPELSGSVSRVNDALRLGELSDNPAYRLTLLGQTFGALEEWELALQALQLAVAADPEYAEAWAYLGEAEQRNGLNGFPSLEHALSLDPESYAANLLMALYYRRSDSPEKALPLLQVVLEQDPNNLALKEEIALAYAENGQVENGLTLLQQAVITSPDQSLAWQILARFCINYDLKLEEIGLPAARQAVLLDDQDPISLMLLARSYLQTGNTAMAERFLLQAARLAPNSAEIHYYLGVVYLNQEKEAAAQEQLTQAYRLEPEGEIGLGALKLIEQYFGESQ